MRSGAESLNPDDPCPRPEDGAIVAPTDRHLEAVSQVFADVLGLERVGPDDDFLNLGGHSLAAMRLVSRLRTAHGLIVPVADVLATPTPRAVSQLVAGAEPPPPSVDEPNADPAPPSLARPTAPAPAQEPNRRAGPDSGPDAGQEPTSGATLPQRTPREGEMPRPGDRPLRPAESAIWFMHRMSGADPAYHEAVALDVDGPIDTRALAATWADLVADHAIFTCTYPVIDGQPVRREGATQAPELEIIGLTGTSDADLDRRIAALASRPFDLDRGPLIRGTVLLRENQPSTLLVVMHHVICDEWTVESLFRQWSDRLANWGDQTAAMDAAPRDPRSLPDDPPRDPERIAVDLDAWRSRLEGATPGLDLPAPRRRRASFGSSGRRVPITWGAAERTAIDTLVDRTGTTPYMVLMTSLHALFARFSDRADHVVGMPSLLTRVDRGREDFGCFVNVLPLRLDLSDDPSFDAAVARTRDRVVEGLRHGAVGLGAIVEATSPPRAGRSTPLFSTALVVRDQPLAPMSIAGTTIRSRPVDLRVARFELTWSVELTETGATGFVEFSADTWTDAAAARLVDQLADVVRAAADTPAATISALELPGGPGAERRFDRRTIGSRRDPRLEGTVDDAVARAAAADGQRTAIAGDGRTLTWQELSAVADRVAANMQAAGVQRGDRVALEVDRSVDLVALLLGILRAGATYVPIDPAYPADRRRWMLEDCAARVLVTNDSDDADDPADVAGVADAHDADPDAGTGPTRLRAADLLTASAPPFTPTGHGPDDAAYIMYTSGSTGRPKGVLVPHRAILRLVVDNDFATLNDTTCVLALAPISFDASTLEIWGPMVNGGRCVFDAEAGLDPERLAAVIRRERVTTMWLTAALYNTLIDTAPHALRGLQELLIGGEALSVTHVRRGLAELPNVRIINGYGPTESTTFACTHPIERPLDARAASVPIGRPINHTAIRIAGATGGPQAPGEPGELWIGGDGLALGYVERPELTAERFVTVPDADGQPTRWYRTGDRVRERSDGAIEFLGRFDDQVKIRGHRIEPGEIAAALRDLRGIRDAVVIAEPAPGNDLRLIAYVVPTSGTPATPVNSTRDSAEDALVADCRAALGRRLPSWMQPTGFVVLDAMPSTANGKLDRARLPQWTPAAGSANPERRGSAVDGPGGELDGGLDGELGGGLGGGLDGGPGGELDGGPNGGPGGEPGDDSFATRSETASGDHGPLDFDHPNAPRGSSSGAPGRAKVRVHRTDRRPTTESGGRTVTPPVTATEAAVVRLWNELFPGVDIDRHDDFFEIGGHSLMAVRLFAGIEARLRRRLPLPRLWTAPTPAALAAAIDTESINLSRRGNTASPATASTAPNADQPPEVHRADDADAESLLVPLRSGDHRPPLFCIAGLGGHPVAFRTLAERLDPDRRFIGLAYPGFSGTQPPHETVEGIAQAMLDEMRRTRRHGPWRIAGYSLGGLVAFEIARRLEADGETIDALILVDSYAPGAIRKRPRHERLRAHLRNLVFGPEEGRWAYLHSRFQRVLARRRGRQLPPIATPPPNEGDAPAANRGNDRGASLESDWNVSPAPHLRQLRLASEQAVTAYAPKPFGGSMQLIRCTDNANDQFTIRSETNGWEDYVDDIDVDALSAMHLDVLEPPGVDELAAIIEARLSAADATLPHENPVADD
ncbi:MAG: amino acid adenylation domain-containing protein [Phycisphaerales bacterium]